MKSKYLLYFSVIIILSAFTASLSGCLNRQDDSHAISMQPTEFNSLSALRQYRQTVSNTQDDIYQLSEISSIYVPNKLVNSSGNAEFKKIVVGEYIYSIHFASDRALAELDQLPENEEIRYYSSHIIIQVDRQSDEDAEKNFIESFSKQPEFEKIDYNNVIYFSNTQSIDDVVAAYKTFNWIEDNRLVSVILPGSLSNDECLTYCVLAQIQLD